LKSKKPHIKDTFIIPMGIVLLFFGLMNAQDNPVDTLISIHQQPSNLSYYVEAGSYGTKRENNPPNYVRNAADLGSFPQRDLNWLLLGLDSRVRGEYRHNDIRRPDSFSEDVPLLLRQRAYLGIVNALDPLRLGVELEDARSNNSIYAQDTRDVNKLELIQGYVEVYIENVLRKDAFGNHRPVSIRYGRMAFEYLDRRLVSVNSWRNTTNTFSGVKWSLGQQSNDWQLEGFIVNPIVRATEKFDHVDTDRLFSAVIGHWRKWSDLVTIEPYYFGLRQDSNPENQEGERTIHGTGLRLYGFIKQSGFNYDLTGIVQFGKDAGLPHKAYAITSEIGYTVNENQNKPRLSAFFGYASGDKNPNDSENNRFERYFGFSRPWSSDDYVIMENIVTSKLKVELQAKFQDIVFSFDGGYSLYWLASATDRFNNGLGGSLFNRDESGTSGSFLGHGLDVRARFSPTPYLSANIGYTHFTVGNFVENRQTAANGESAGSSDFAYVELSINILDLLAYNTNLNRTAYNK
jgi:hypothetical protein